MAYDEDEKSGVNMGPKNTFHRGGQKSFEEQQKAALDSDGG